MDAELDDALVSVVVATYDPARRHHLDRLLDRLKEQTYTPREFVVVVDGHDELAASLRNAYEDEGDVRVVALDENVGASAAKTKGAEAASGEIVVFIDDDAVPADDEWLREHVAAHRSGAIAVTGPITPRWESKSYRDQGDGLVPAAAPWWFPAEFLWLVGCTRPGFAADGDVVRNGYGANISYRRDAFLAVGGYDPRTGLSATRRIQAHEAPVCLRIRAKYGEGVLYWGAACVEHTIVPEQTRFMDLVARSFWQGYSKHVLGVILDADTHDPGSERDYLSELALDAFPGYLVSAVRERSGPALGKAVALVVLTLAVGLGYVYGVVDERTLRRSWPDAGDADAA